MREARAQREEQEGERGKGSKDTQPPYDRSVLSPKRIKSDLADGFVVATRQFTYTSGTRKRMWRFKAGCNDVAG